MTPQPLSSETQRRVELVFAETERTEAGRLLVEECGNKLPFLQKLDEYQLERYRFAALKLSGGDLTKLKEAIAMAKVDWRDLLVAAGFGHDPEAHKHWLAAE